jgi:hypothetical protein
MGCLEQDSRIECCVSRAFSSQVDSPDGSENAENKKEEEHDPIHAKRIMLQSNFWTDG